MTCAYCKEITVCAICGKGYAEAARAEKDATPQAVAWRYRFIYGSTHGDWTHVGHEPQGDNSPNFQKEPLYTHEPAALGVAVAARAELIEKKAREIYDGWKHMPGWVPWVEHGNSHKQDEARSLARSALAGVGASDGKPVSHEPPMGEGMKK